MNKSPGRNDPCLCNSGKKYKKCCLMKRMASAAKAASEAEQRKACICARARDRVSPRALMTAAVVHSFLGGLG